MACLARSARVLVITLLIVATVMTTSSPVAECRTECDPDGHKRFEISRGRQGLECAQGGCGGVIRRGGGGGAGAGAGEGYH
ncbi:hypothetical protein ZWY2020_031608 [Hordeum vulgare]|nr:hypothetical protein ZWY2020_031608 [Hordeum vulgare]